MKPIFLLVGSLLVLFEINQSGAETKVDKWGLWIESTQLRGANIYQRRVYPELDGPTFMGSGPVGPPYTQDDFDQLAAMGANYVNISHPGLFTEKSPYTLDQDIQNNVDSLLNMIANANMFAVISFRTGPGRSEFTFFWDEVGDWFDASYLNDSVWQDQAAQDAWISMWRYTAQRYRDNPIVVGYDLMVEPNSNEVGSHPLNNLLDVWDPEEFYSNYGGTLYDWNQFYPNIITAIRQVDTMSPILIGGMGYSAVEWLPYMQTTGDPRTVFTVHQYAPYVYTHQTSPLVNTYPGVFDTDWDGVDDQFNQTWLDNLLSTVDTFAATYGVPVAVNEFGVVRWEPGAAEFMDDQMNLFEQRGMNYALWVWDPAWEPWNEEIDAFNFRHGPHPFNHTDVDSSDLMDVIVRYWGHNTMRPSSVEEIKQDGLSKQFAVRQNYPNPFNLSTTIEFTIPRCDFVSLKVFNILGEQVATLIAQELPSGRHTAKWNASGFASGVYHYRLILKSKIELGSSFVKTKKLILLP